MFIFKPIITKLHLARISEPGVWLYSIQYAAGGPLHYMYMQEESAKQLQQYIDKVHPQPDRGNFDQDYDTDYQSPTEGDDED